MRISNLLWPLIIKKKQLKHSYTHTSHQPKPLTLSQTNNLSNYSSSTTIVSWYSLEVRNVTGELVIHNLPRDRAVIFIVVLLEGHRVKLGMDVGLTSL